MADKRKDKHRKESAKTPAPFVRPGKWWEDDVKSTTMVLDELRSIDNREVVRQREAEEANFQLEQLAVELQWQEDERKRLYGDKFPMVYGDGILPAPQQRRGGRPPGSKNKPKS